MNANTKFRATFNIKSEKWVTIIETREQNPGKVLIAIGGQGFYFTIDEAKQMAAALDSAVKSWIT